MTEIIQTVIAFLFTVAFWPGISGAATTPRWAILSVTVAISLFFIKPRITLAHVLLASLLGWMGFSLLWSTVGYDWMLMFFRMSVLCGIFVIGAETKSIKPFMVGCICGMTVNSVVVIAQIFGWEGIGQLVPPGGLFLNRDIGSETAALLLIAMAYHGPRFWLAMPLVLPSIVIPHSRGSIAAIAAVGTMWLFRKRPRVMVVISAVAVAFVALHYLKHSDGAVDERFNIWLDTLNGYKWFGHGLGQYYVTYPDLATRIDTLQQRPEHAHNDLLELGYELGCGVVLVIAFLRAMWRGSLPAEKAVLLGFAVEGCFGFPLYMPVSAAIFAVMAGRLSGSGPSVFDDLHDSRMGQLLRLELFAKAFRRRA